jgi:hypothetical protein
MRRLSILVLRWGRASGRLLHLAEGSRRSRYRAATRRANSTEVGSTDLPASLNRSAEPRKPGGRNLGVTEPGVKNLKTENLCENLWVRPISKLNWKSV